MRGEGYHEKILWFLGWAMLVTCRRRRAAMDSTWLMYWWGVPPVAYEGRWLRDAALIAGLLLAAAFFGALLIVASQMSPRVGITYSHDHDTGTALASGASRQRLTRLAAPAPPPP